MAMTTGHQPWFFPFSALLLWAMPLRHLMENKYSCSSASGLVKGPRDDGNRKNSLSSIALARPEGYGESTASVGSSGAYREQCGLSGLAALNLHPDFLSSLPVRSTPGQPRLPQPCFSFTHIFISCQVRGDEVSVKP